MRKSRGGEVGEVNKEKQRGGSTEEEGKEEVNLIRREDTTRRSSALPIMLAYIARLSFCIAGSSHKATL